MSSSIGRDIRVAGARIAGVVSCLPSHTVDNRYFESAFQKSDIDNVIKMIGVSSRRWAGSDTTTSDLCTLAAKRLMEKLGWDADTIDAVIFVSQTPDHLLPASACIIQRSLGLSPQIIAFDVNLGCSGYVYGLWLGMSMIQSGAAKRVILAVGDTISKVVNPGDRATAMLFGDAGTATALEEATSDAVNHFVLGADGSGAADLIVQNGGFRQPSAGDDRHLYMNGGEIFNFTLRTVPALVSQLMRSSQLSIEDQDFLLFHQANLFMLNHLVKKVKIPSSKAPINIQQFGNTSSASIPLLMTESIAQDLLQRACRISMYGFGVGFSWGAASLIVGPLRCAETIEQR